jgi:cephalosporin-C deacetylase-like acetyl esterase
MKKICFILMTLVVAGLLCPSADALAWNEHYTALQQHMVRAIGERTNKVLAGLSSLEGWQAQRGEIKAKLEHAFGFDREWPTEPPSVEITGTTERDGFTVENLVIESAPGVYLTANLYLPGNSANEPCPVIVYESGHWSNPTFGNKSRFKPHGAWFASRGIAVLIMDSIELGELTVTHHGFYFNQWYDLVSRGYSPLTVEIFNARRAIDYLITRSDIDPQRIGATGISGGGVTTFFLAALDERIAAAAPVSGVCSALGHVADRLAVLHCDCMYPMNSYGLTYVEMGALTAPRPLLMCNAESDILFPMPYFNQLYKGMKEVYKLYGAGDKIGTATVPGIHADSEEIRLPVYRFYMSLFLGRDEKITEHGAVDTSFSDNSLIAMSGGFPTDERLTRIHEEFMPRAAMTPLKLSDADRSCKLDHLRGRLSERVFNFFPAESSAPQPQWGQEYVSLGRRYRQVQFEGWAGIMISALYSLPEKVVADTRLPAVVAIRSNEPSLWNDVREKVEDYHWGERAVLTVELLDTRGRAIDDSLRHQMRRQATIIGRSFDGMRVYELLRSLDLLRSFDEVDSDRITIIGKKALGINGLYACLLDSQGTSKTAIVSPVASHTEGPFYLGVLRVTDIPEVISLMGERVRVVGQTPLALDLYMERANPGLRWKFRSLAEVLQ